MSDWYGYVSDPPGKGLGKEAREARCARPPSCVQRVIPRVTWLGVELPKGSWWIRAGASPEGGAAGKLGGPRTTLAGWLGSAGAPGLTPPEAPEDPEAPAAYDFLCTLTHQAPLAGLYRKTDTRGRSGKRGRNGCRPTSGAGRPPAPGFCEHG